MAPRIARQYYFELIRWQHKATNEEDHGYSTTVMELKLILFIQGLL